MKVNFLKESRIFRQAGSLFFAAAVGFSAFSYVGLTPGRGFTPPTPPPTRTPPPTPTPTPTPPGSTPSGGTTTICFHNITMTVQTSTLGNYAGYTPGPCPTPPPTSGN